MLIEPLSALVVVQLSVVRSPGKMVVGSAVREASGAGGGGFTVTRNDTESGLYPDFVTLTVTVAVPADCPRIVSSSVLLLTDTVTIPEGDELAL